MKVKGKNMQVIQGGGQSERGVEWEKRRKLLAMVHIAKKEIGLSEDQYDAVLRGFKVESSADLSNVRLERLVRYMKQLGWKASGRRNAEIEMRKEEGQKQALRERINRLAAELENGDRRLRALCQKLFAVDDAKWIGEVKDLRRVLAIVAHLKDKKVTE